MQYNLMSPTQNSVYWVKDLLIIVNIYFIIIFTFLIYLTLIILLLFKFYKAWAFGSDTKGDGPLQKWKGRVEKNQKIHTWKNEYM